jgi:hypothetical protein
MYEMELLICGAVVTIALFLVLRTWKDVKTSQFNMEAARSRRMSQVRAARGNAPAPAASGGQHEVTPEWVYSLLNRLGIEEIPDEEPPGLASALDKYEPLIRPFLKGLTEGAGQQQQQQEPGETFL